jgi:antitoxin (DNA-binding transcriptional repressor) of toxin-antitoxin stability system
MTTIVDIEVVRRDLSGLLKLVSSGDEILISDGDTPVARLSGVTAAQPTPRVAGLHPNAVWTADDFDAPLPDDYWSGSA